MQNLNPHVPSAADGSIFFAPTKAKGHRKQDPDRQVDPEEAQPPLYNRLHPISRSQLMIHTSNASVITSTSAGPA